MRGIVSLKDFVFDLEIIEVMQEEKKYKHEKE